MNKLKDDDYDSNDEARFNNDDDDDKEANYGSDDEYDDNNDITDRNLQGN